MKQRDAILIKLSAISLSLNDLIIGFIIGVAWLSIVEIAMGGMQDIHLYYNRVILHDAQQRIAYFSQLIQC